jgi:hypothetical protein
MNFVALFFAGAFLCNAIPHLSSGLQGIPFPTPFAKPRGIGNSPPVVNVLWAFVNLLVGALLLRAYPVTIGVHWEFAALIAGALAIGIYLSLHFAKIGQDKQGK